VKPQRSQGPPAQTRHFKPGPAATTAPTLPPESRGYEGALRQKPHHDSKRVEVCLASASSAPARALRRSLACAQWSRHALHTHAGVDAVRSHQHARAQGIRHAAEAHGDNTGTGVLCVGLELVAPADDTRGNLSHDLRTEELPRDVNIVARHPAVGDACAGANPARARRCSSLFLAMLLRRDGRSVALPAHVAIGAVSMGFTVRPSLEKLTAVPA
jgi:hypothetical protein